MRELSSVQITELHQDLDDLKALIFQQLENVKNATQAVMLDQQAIGRVSRIDAIQQQNMAQASQAQWQERLRHITHALAAIGSGDYGFCRSCDKPIGFDRLKVRPETPLCVHCQGMIE